MLKSKSCCPSRSVALETLPDGPVAACGNVGSEYRRTPNVHDKTAMCVTRRGVFIVFPPYPSFVRAIEPGRVARSRYGQPAGMSFDHTFENDAMRGIFIEPLCMEFAIPLSKDGEPLFRQVYLGLRQAILSGVFSSGERLPSTRDLAEQLGISRTVVLLAYDQLLAEGFAEGHHGSGTYVSRSLGGTGSRGQEKLATLQLSRFGAAAADAAGTVNFPNRRPAQLRYDFAYGRSDMSIFPFEAWRRILLRHALRASVRELDYGPAAGALSLREAICTHLKRSRAVVCEPSEVIVVNGAQQALDL